MIVTSAAPATRLGQNPIFLEVAKFLYPYEKIGFDKPEHKGWYVAARGLCLEFYSQCFSQLRESAPYDREDEIHKPLSVSFDDCTFTAFDCGHEWGVLQRGPETIVYTGESLKSNFHRGLAGYAVNVDSPINLKIDGIAACSDQAAEQISHACAAVMQQFLGGFAKFKQENGGGNKYKVRDALARITTSQEASGKVLWATHVQPLVPTRG